MSEEKSPIVEAEKLISELSEELQKLKNASQRLDDVNQKSEYLIETSKKIIENSNNLHSVGYGILKELEKGDVPNNMKKLSDSVEKVVETQSEFSKDMIKISGNINAEIGSIRQNQSAFSDDVKKGIEKIDTSIECLSKAQEEFRNDMDVRIQATQKTLKNYQIASILLLILVLVASVTIYLKP